jgi:hypothetical protein
MNRQTQNMSSKSSSWTMPIIVVVLAAIAIGIYLSLSDSEPVAPAVAPAIAPKGPTRFGPGMLSNAQPEIAAPVDHGYADPGAPPGLEVTPGQQLMVNKEMRNVFDYFLVPGGAAERPVHLARLQAHLKAKLPPPAYAEAAEIAANYSAYLTALEKLRSTELNLPKTQMTSIPLNAQDAERFSAKISEITRLRQSLLGVKVAQLWYGEEEEAMQQSLTELREHNATVNQ